MSQVSIVIPTLDESACLERTLRQLTILQPPAWEIIVVDGGSQDDTIALAKRCLESINSITKTKVIQYDRRGRSTQMNAGANAATGEILCFLHADTWVPDDIISVMEQTLTDPKIACGGFISLMVGQKTRWGISLHNYLKTYYAPLLFRPHLFIKGLRLLFGDQVMFCRRADFWDCRGFDEALPIMEDGDLCRRLLQKGRIWQVDRVVQSSDRRVKKWGAWKATALYLYIGILWGIGVSASYLKRFYEDIR